MKTAPSPLPPLRKALLKDSNGLASLEKEIFSYNQVSRQSFNRFIRGTAEIWLQDGIDEIAGYILVLRRKGSKKLRIYSLAVSPRYRGRGIARKLMTHIFAKFKNYDSIKLEVKQGNIEAIRLYESLGFELEKELIGFFSDGADGFSYRKGLKKV